MECAFYNWTRLNPYSPPRLPGVNPVWAQSQELALRTFVGGKNGIARLKADIYNMWLTARHSLLEQIVPTKWKWIFPKENI